MSWYKLKRGVLVFKDNDDMIEPTVEFKEYSKIKTYLKTTINSNCRMIGEIEVGVNVMIGTNVLIVAESHVTERKDLPMVFQPIKSNKIVIGDDVFIGAGAIVLAGVTIGKGSIIGAGSVVLEDTKIGEYEVWAGNPATFKKKR